MKIFIIGPEEIYQWTESVVRAAHALGLDVSEGRYTSYQTHRVCFTLERFKAPQLFINTANRLDLGYKAYRHKQLCKTVKQLKPDLTLVLKGETLSEESLGVLKKHSGQLMTWWVDDPGRHPEAEKLLKNFDSIFVFDKGIIQRLEAEGLETVNYLPCACDPEIFHPKEMKRIDDDLDCEVAFVASCYPEREALVEQMKDVDLGLWGPGWANAAVARKLKPGVLRGRKLSPEDCCNLYNWVKVCPNIHHAQTKKGGFNTRTFEILSAGGFQLVDHVEGIESMFELGKELQVYKNPSEFRELLIHYLEHKEERLEMTKLGRKRVLEEHTYKNRLESLLTHV